MEVKLIAHTDKEEMLEFIGEVAGVAYGRTGNNRRRAMRCIGDNHLSVTEHVSFTWVVENVSRACTHQLVRHRLASYLQKSQRYTKMKQEMVDWFVVPQTVKDKGFEHVFKLQAANALDTYIDMLEGGVPAEDARYILPEATYSTIVVTMNFREFINFYALRSAPDAQWEIRELAEKMRDEAVKAMPDVAEVC